MTRDTDARTLALDTLEAVERRHAYADVTLDGMFSRFPTLRASDRALASHLVYGVLRWRNQLDAHLARAASRPLKKIHPTLLQILRLGAYQILHLDRVPARAAVSEAVDLARQRGLAHAAGFVNALLRRLAVSGDELPLPEDLPHSLSLRFGCPLWLVESWIAEYGEEGSEILCRCASRIPPLWLRVDTRRIAREKALTALAAHGIDVAPGRQGPEAVRVDGGGDPRDLPLVRDGLAVVQDQASQLVAHLLAPRAGWRVLDACAAPGLKATHLVQLGGASLTVTALEIHPHRARRMEQLFRRWSPDQFQVETTDARHYRAETPYDAVLVDAPCSGLGVLDRTPEAKWRRKPEERASLVTLQEEILAATAQAVAPGGILVYATCTTAREENEGVVGRFLERHGEFHLEPPPEGPVDWAPFLAADGYFRTFPLPAEQDPVDGFFGARLRRAA